MNKLRKLAAANTITIVFSLRIIEFCIRIELILIIY